MQTILKNDVSVFALALHTKSPRPATGTHVYMCMCITGVMYYGMYGSVTVLISMLLTVLYKRE